MNPAVVVISHSDYRCKGSKGVAAVTGDGGLFLQVLVHQARRRLFLTDDVVGERHVYLAGSVALKRGTMVIKPVDLDPLRSQTAQMRVGLFLCPGDVGDPQLTARRSCVRTDRAEDLVDALVPRKVGDDSGTGPVARHGYRRGYTVETIGAVANNVNQRGMRLSAICLHTKQH